VCRHPIKLSLRFSHLVVYFFEQFCLLLELLVDVFGVPLEVFCDCGDLLQLFVIFVDKVLVPLFLHLIKSLQYNFKFYQTLTFTGHLSLPSFLRVSPLRV
jgi:hypothetical protein